VVVHMYEQNLSTKYSTRTSTAVLSTNSIRTFQSDSTVVRIKFSTKLVRFVQFLIIFCITQTRKINFLLHKK
jgi:hypothetical protein